VEEHVTYGIVPRWRKSLGRTLIDSINTDRPPLSGKPKADLLVMSADGKGIVMRHEDLRQQTRQRAAGTSHKLSSQLSRGEKRNRKRMATVSLCPQSWP
jgi:hypothetical protein